MELHDAIRRRAMVRSFSEEPIDPTVVDRLLEGAIRAPTAGHTRGTAWVALEGEDQTAAYWSATTDALWRAEQAAWAEGLMRAPVLLLSYASPDAYVARYAAPDKEASGLGLSAEHWPIPYWYCDAAFSMMLVLLGAVDAGLGACLLGAFRGEQAVATALGVPAGWRLFGAVALGYPDGGSHRSSSLDRPGPKAADRIHRGSW